MSGSFRFFAVASALAVLTACSSSPRIGELPSLPKDLPPDFQAKFNVVEPDGSPRKAAPAPAAKAELARGKRLSRKKKGSARAAPTPFAYPNRRPKIDPIWVGERQVLEITYIGMRAGEFTLDVLPMKEIAGRKVYHLRARALTSSMMNLFYRLDDTIESFWDYETLFSHRFHLVLDETKQKRDALELFDAEAKKAFYWDRRNHVDKGASETKATFDIEPAFPQDSFTALYYMRTLPLEDGKAYTFPVVSEGKSWEAVVTVVRRETLDTPLGRKRCVVVKPQTRFNGVLKQERGDSFIWLTDDDRRFIVRLEAQVKVGSVAAQMKSVELGEKPNEQ